MIVEHIPAEFLGDIGIFSRRNRHFYSYFLLALSSTVCSAAATWFREAPLLQRHFLHPSLLSTVWCCQLADWHGFFKSKAVAVKSWKLRSQIRKYLKHPCFCKEKNSSISMGFLLRRLIPVSMWNEKGKNELSLTWRSVRYYLVRLFVKQWKFLKNYDHQSLLISFTCKFSLSLNTHHPLCLPLPILQAVIGGSFQKSFIQVP